MRHDYLPQPALYFPSVDTIQFQSSLLEHTLHHHPISYPLLHDPIHTLPPCYRHVHFTTTHLHFLTLCTKPPPVKRRFLSTHPSTLLHHHHRHPPHKAFRDKQAHLVASMALPTSQYQPYHSLYTMPHRVL